MSAEPSRTPAAHPTPFNGAAVAGERSLGAAGIARLVAARRSGVGATALARQLGISRRTVYRWEKARIVTVTVDGWTAQFAIRPAGSDQAREGPVQISHWRHDGGESNG